MDPVQFSILIRGFDRNEERRKEIDRVRETLKDFQRHYPFVSNPQAIDTLTADQIYKKGEDQTFFYWVERKLRVLGHITVYANWFENARANSEIFKRLLRDSLKEGLSLSQRIDPPWDSIGGFGGDRTIAKKIISWNMATTRWVAISSFAGKIIFHLRGPLRPCCHFSEGKNQRNPGIAELSKLRV